MIISIVPIIWDFLEPKTITGYFRSKRSYELDLRRLGLRAQDRGATRGATPLVVSEREHQRLGTVRRRNSRWRAFGARAGQKVRVAQFTMELMLCGLPPGSKR